MIGDDVLSLGADIAVNGFSSEQFEPYIINSINQINDSLMVIIVFIGAILGAFIIRSLRR